MSNLQEKKEDYILSLDNSGQLTKMDIIEQNLNAIDFGYELCKREYEEKLRWTHVFEELPDLNSVIELKSENKRFLGIVKLKNYQGENRYYVQGMYQATGDIDILYNFSHWRKAIL